VFSLCFIFLSFIGADVSAHRAFLSWSDHYHLLSILCTFLIEQINDDEMMMMTTARLVKCRPAKCHPVICQKNATQAKYNARHIGIFQTGALEQSVHKNV